MIKKKGSYKKGMTLIELIVVLAIFAVLSTVVIFNYTTFQSRIDIQNLASDTALQVVNAQRSALNGLLPPTGYVPDNSGYPTKSWTPAYGVYFSKNTTLGADLGADYKDFISFVDLNNNNLFDSASGESLSTYTITQGDYISDISVFLTSSPSSASPTSNLAVTFSRPSSGAIFSNGYPNNPGVLSGVYYVEITVLDQTGKTPPAKIDLYPSGRVQIN